MAVITITREMATGGGKLGRLLARRLDYQYVDKSLFQNIAEDLNVSERTLESFEEKRRYGGYDKSVVREEEYKKSLESHLLGNCKYPYCGAARTHKRPNSKVGQGTGGK